MAPMVPPGNQGQGGQQGKSPKADRESIYQKKRAWTEAVIGLPSPRAS